MSEIPESKKPREWIIKTERIQIGDSNNYELYQIAEGEYIGNGKKIKVIERSAYEQLQKQNQELIKALEFYADGDNWEYIAPDKVDYRVIEKSDFGIGEFQLTELTDDEWVGGRRAREVLAKYQKGDL